LKSVYIFYTLYLLNFLTFRTEKLPLILLFKIFLLCMYEYNLNLVLFKQNLTPNTPMHHWRVSQPLSTYIRYIGIDLAMSLILRAQT